VFGDRLALKIYFDSRCNVFMVHNGQRLRDRYVALLKGWIILFRDRERLDAIRRMTFFSDTIFRDYARTQNCQCIPLRNAEIVRNFKSEYGQWSFEVAIGDRCWFFGVESMEILTQWLHLLTRRDDADFSHFEHSTTALSSGPDFTEQFILSPAERLKNIKKTAFDLNELHEMREDDGGGDGISVVVEEEAGAERGGDPLPPLTPGPTDAASAGSPREGRCSEPIAIPSRHSTTRSKTKGLLNVGGMDQEPHILVEPAVAPQPRPKWSRNSQSASSSTTHHTIAMDDDIDTPLQSMDGWNSSLTQEIKL